LLYLTAAACLFARPAAAHFGSAYFGRGVDQPFFIWCLVWWPYALAHHLNPFISKLVFAPSGLNLTWTTSIPLLSLVALPLTKTFGPIAAYNLLCVICPALAAWTTFLLCHRLTDAFWPSLLGGYIFGFSAYVLGHVIGGHPDCFAIFLLPAIVHLVLARLDEQVTKCTFTLALMTLLAAQFLIADEMFATMTLVGAAALAVGWLLGGSGLKRRIEDLAAPVCLGYVGTAVLMIPWLYYVFLGFIQKPLRAPQEYSIDLLNLVIPTATMSAGVLYSPLLDFSSHFTGNITEQSGYIGLPLLFIVIWFAAAHRQTLAGRILTAMLALSIALAMGPRLHIGGVTTVPMPWRVIEHLELLNQALPGRVFLYSTLILAMLAAIWFSDTRVGLAIRIPMGMAVALSLVPSVSALQTPRPERQTLPELFSSGQYRRYIAKDEIVVVPPAGWGAGSEAMLWQAATGMYFRLATGYLPFAPASIFQWPIVTALIQHVELPDAADQWGAFAANHQTALVITCKTVHSAALKELFEELGALPQKVGGVTLFRMPSGTLAKYRDADAIGMEAIEQETRFRQLLAAARAYFDPRPDKTIFDADSTGQQTQNALAWKPWGMQPRDSSITLSAVDPTHVAIGVTGTYEALLPLIQDYGKFALSLYLPYPHPLGEVRPPKNHCPRPLVMIFDRGGLRQAEVAAAKRAGQLLN
jgi:hypothetical protein